jgi:hypothetical protein
MSVSKFIDFCNVLEEIKSSGAKNESVDYIIQYIFENDVHNLNYYITFINGKIGDYGAERKLGFGPKAIETFKERIPPANNPSSYTMFEIIYRLESLADQKLDEAIKSMKLNHLELDYLLCFIGNKLKLGFSTKKFIKRLSTRPDFEESYDKYTRGYSWKDICNPLIKIDSGIKNHPFRPMLAKTFKCKQEDLSKSDNIIQAKIDGIHGIVIKNEDEVNIYSRSGKLLNDKYPHLLNELFGKHLKTDEIIIPEKIRIY